MMANLAESISKGDRRALAKAITLVESIKPEHQKEAQDLLEELLPSTGGSFRIGVSGPPGVGKSTFIEVLGTELIESHKKKVAVLAIDPSSPVHGGSLLADKTRMERLSQNENAFVRPSPSAGALGGVTYKTREAILLCEAAGFDTVIVETVGVGQSEVDVVQVVDFYLTLMLPNAGDELQGIKKGILELTQAIVINKYDGNFKAAADTAEAQYKSVIDLISKDEWKPPVLKLSSLEEKGFAELVASLRLFQENFAGAIKENRRQQNVSWFNRLIRDEMESLIRKNISSSDFEALVMQVSEGRLSALAAKEEIFANINL